MVVRQPSKLNTRVRFPLPAPKLRSNFGARLDRPRRSARSFRKMMQFGQYSLHPKGGPPTPPFLEMYHVYVLQSLRDQRTYVGYTDNVERRFHEHNSGRSRATKHRRPFTILFTEEFDTVKAAKQRELWGKSGAGRRKLNEYFARLGKTMNSLPEGAPSSN